MTFYETEIKRIRNICYRNDKQIETVIATRNFIDNNFEKEVNLDFLSHIRFTSKISFTKAFQEVLWANPKTIFDYQKT